MTQNLALLRLLQLASSTLPVGAYSYSEGIEALVQTGKITEAASLAQWLTQELQYGAVRLEAAVMLRAQRSTLADEPATLWGWNRWLSAARETEELRSQSHQMGRSLLRLFQDLQPAAISPEMANSLAVFQQEGCNFAVAYGFVAAHWTIDETAATLGYLHSWAANLISAGIKLIPLGQTAGQQLLLEFGTTLDRAVPEILALEDDRLASCGWGLSLASMTHETLYSRLFRS